MNPQMFANMWHPSMMAGMPFDPTGAMLMQNKLVVKPKKRGGGPQNSPIKIKHKTWTEWKYYRSHQAAVDDNDELLCLGHPLARINDVLNPKRRDKSVAGFRIVSLRDEMEEKERQAEAAAAAEAYQQQMTAMSSNSPFSLLLHAATTTSSGALTQPSDGRAPRQSMAGPSADVPLCVPSGADPCTVYAFPNQAGGLPAMGGGEGNKNLPKYSAPAMVPEPTPQTTNGKRKFESVDDVADEDKTINVEDFGCRVVAPTPGEGFKPAFQFTANAPRRD